MNCNAYEFDDATQSNIGIVKPIAGCGKACLKQKYEYYKFFSDSGTCICFKTMSGAWPPETSQCGSQGGVISSGTHPGNNC